MNSTVHFGKLTRSKLRKVENVKDSAWFNAINTRKRGRSFLDHSFLHVSLVMR